MIFVLSISVVLVHLKLNLNLKIQCPLLHNPKYTIRVLKSKNDQSCFFDQLMIYKELVIFHILFNLKRMRLKNFYFADSSYLIKTSLLMQVQLFLTNLKHNEGTARKFSFEDFRVLNLSSFLSSSCSC